MPRALLLVALVALIAPPARAELPPLIPRDVLFGNPDKTGPQLSPDGKRLAYLAPDDKNVLQVWVRSNPALPGIADAKKVAIMGGSYGGYATLVGLTFTPDVFACGVDIVGPSNIATLLKTIPPYWAPMKSARGFTPGYYLTTPSGLTGFSPNGADR